MTIRTDRGFAYSLKPINKYINLPLTTKDNETYFDYWDHKDHMILDILSDYIFNEFYKNKKPASMFELPNKYILKNVKNEKFFNNFDLYNDSTSEYIFEFEDRILYQKYPLLRKYNSTQLFKMIEAVSKKKFNMKYNIRFVKKNVISKNKINLHPYNKEYLNTKPENIFDLNVISDDVKYIKNRKYELKFNSLIGLGFIQNILLLNLNLIINNKSDKDKYKIYDLSNLSQFIYRRFISIHKKNKKTNLAIQDFEEFIPSYKTNLSIFKIKITKAFNELIDKKVISDFNVIGKSCYTVYEFKKL